MLISYFEINELLIKYNINITGVLHVGAHECEEYDLYSKLGLNGNDIIWIEAIPNKVQEAKDRGICNIYNYCITDRDDIDTVLNISNNVQSSSILNFGTHSQEHPDVYYVDKITQKSITIDTFFNRNYINSNKYNFWNFDIQGAEYLALKGSKISLKNVDVIYLEVNEKQLYENCGLITDIDKYLLQFNFKRMKTYMTKHGWGDAIYIKNK